MMPNAKQYLLSFLLTFSLLVGASGCSRIKKKPPDPAPIVQETRTHDSIPGTELKKQVYPTQIPDYNPLYVSSHVRNLAKEENNLMLYALANEIDSHLELFTKNNAEIYIEMPPQGKTEQYARIKINSRDGKTQYEIVDKKPANVRVVDSNRLVKDTVLWLSELVERYEHAKDEKQKKEIEARLAEKGISIGKREITENERMSLGITTYISSTTYYFENNKGIAISFPTVKALSQLLKDYGWKFWGNDNKSLLHPGITYILMGYQQHISPFNEPDISPLIFTLSDFFRFAGGSDTGIEIYSVYRMYYPGIDTFRVNEYLRAIKNLFPQNPRLGKWLAESIFYHPFINPKLYKKVDDTSTFNGIVFLVNQEPLIENISSGTEPDPTKLFRYLNLLAGEKEMDGWTVHFESVAHGSVSNSGLVTVRTENNKQKTLWLYAYPKNIEVDDGNLGIVYSVKEVEFQAFMEDTGLLVEMKLGNGRIEHAIDYPWFMNMVKSNFYDNMTCGSPAFYPPDKNIMGSRIILLNLPNKDGRYVTDLYPVNSAGALLKHAEFGYLNLQVLNNVDNSVESYKLTRPYADKWSVNPRSDDGAWIPAFRTKYGDEYWYGLIDTIEIYPILPAPGASMVPYRVCGKMPINGKVLYFYCPKEGEGGPRPSNIPPDRIPIILGGQNGLLP